jgi:hypothetical protein
MESGNYAFLRIAMPAKKTRMFLRKYHRSLCCGSGSGILDPEPFGPLDPGSRMGKKSGSIPEHISESLETILLGLKYLTGSWREKIPIRNLVVCIQCTVWSISIL